MLKERLIEQEQMLPDEIYNIVEAVLYTLKLERQTNSKSIQIWLRHPEDIYALCYQDGLIHALERAIALKKTAYYSHACNIAKVIKNYEKVKKEKIKLGKYDDVSYIEGYITGLTIIPVTEDKLFMLKIFPRYYVYGYKNIVTNLSEYKKIKKCGKSSQKGF